MTRLAGIGRTVRYCGHDASFVADITAVGTAYVVRHAGPLTMQNVTRPAGRCDVHMVESASGQFWRPDLGVFVIPQDRLRKI